MTNGLKFLFNGLGFILFAHARRLRPDLEAAASRPVEHNPNILTDSALRVADSARTALDRFSRGHKPNARQV